MIKIEDVHFTYPNSVEALRGVNLEIADGDFIAIMGQNGAGKTTLVKHINGLLKPTKGIVCVDAMDTTKVSVAKLARSVGFVFQNPDHQLFSETVEDEISFALKNFGYKENEQGAIIEDTLSQFNLKQYRNQYGRFLSIGEQQRAALATVLMLKPSILVLDEPTHGMDI